MIIFAISHATKFTSSINLSSVVILIIRMWPFQKLKKIAAHIKQYCNVVKIIYLILVENETKYHFSLLNS